MSDIKISLANGKAVLSGFLDENSDLKVLESVKGALAINFKDVSRVNSCGVREWVNLIAKIQDASISYDECPIVVVKQLNAVPDFQGKAKVISFYAPYFCESCDKEAVTLLKTEQMAANGAPPEMKCPTCTKPMNFDAIPNQYLSFLKR
jgi:thiol-disulfide isomerase/thioredoxin